MVKLNSPLKYSFLALLLVHWNAIQAHQWTNLYNAYLFAPGLWSSEHQAAKYCSRYEASTGQIVLGKHGHQLIQGGSTKACNFSEIRVTEVRDLNKAYQSWWPYNLIMRSMYTLGKSILTASNNRYKIFFDGQPDNKLTLDPYTLCFKNLNFGQIKDTTQVSRTYDSLCNEYPESDIVLFGASRGAAALLNFMALLYPEKIHKKVKGIVVEGCFDSLDNLTNFSYLISFFCDYRYQGISPIHPLIVQLLVNVCTAYKIPLLFVTSLKDQRVPAFNTYNLCAVLKEAGMKDLYCLTLKKSTHSAYLKDDVEDAMVYEAVVHAFYQKYGLSHDLTLAHKGSVWLRGCQI